MHQNFQQLHYLSCDCRYFSKPQNGLIKISQKFMVKGLILAILVFLLWLLVIIVVATAAVVLHVYKVMRRRWSAV